MKKNKIDVKSIISWAPILLLLMSVTFGLLDPEKTSIPSSLIQWGLFFSVGAQNLWSWISNTVYADSTAISAGWKSSPFQFEVASANLGIGIAALLAPWYSPDYWLALIIIACGFFWSSAYGHVKQMIVKNNFALDNAGPIFYTQILVPLMLLVSYFAM